MLPPDRPAAPRGVARRLALLVASDVVAGMLLLCAAAAAIIVANTPAADRYVAVRDTAVGPQSLGLHLTVGEWTSDGLLAVFFFLVGLELLHELTDGQLADRRRAAVPVLAAVGGMVVPAACYLIVTGGDARAAVGWAIPTATDIAFALAVLAVAGRFLPPVLRTFLLTLAVADDLLAIIVIAVAYTRGVHLVALLGALAAVALFAFVVRWQRLAAPLRVALSVCCAVAAWALMHGSGVHATIAGVLLGFAIPVRGSGAVAARLDSVVRPVSAGLVVPLFAFFAAGVTLDGLGAVMTAPVTMGVMVGLVVGKTVGIAGTALLVTRLTRSTLLAAASRWDLVGVAAIGGVGFTVSLLIGHLAFADDAARAADAQVGVLAGSLLAAALGVSILRVRQRAARSARRHGVVE